MGRQRRGRKFSPVGRAKLEAERAERPQPEIMGRAAADAEQHGRRAHFRGRPDELPGAQ